MNAALTKGQRTKDAILALLREHADDPDGLPTTIRFVFYELEQRGLATKPKPDDTRTNRRRSIGWPPGSQDITDALTRLRDAGIVPWDWLADTERSVAVWDHAPTVGEYLLNRLAEATINPWHPEPPPLILTEAKGMAAVLDRVAATYSCPIAGTKGQSQGFLRTVIAPLLAVAGREVLYLGDLDRCGQDIEDNTRRVLERASGRELTWTRIGLIAEQADGIEPIWKIDGRDGQGHWAWEVESLGQAAVVALVREALDARVPEPLPRVQEREDEQRARLGQVLRDAQ